MINGRKERGKDFKEQALPFQGVKLVRLYSSFKMKERFSDRFALRAIATLPPGVREEGTLHASCFTPRKQNLSLFPS